MTNAQAAMIAAASTMNPMNYNSLALRTRAHEMLEWLQAQEWEGDTFG
jgi:hypothetical protein